ncbi:hypothetical protein H8A95_15820 [Bradyrhizobium sp. Pear76]|uniref:hypothetical protein n=1 Tax=Bradyrhizobium oropedii TaxID=1571201 RepID=UPI001E2E7E03|nr:hypothetical protein [Bradyrhizobium oropedii]MCC8963738.1 hypothetical protein [Bradyrhizobium oropedii]
MTDLLPAISSAAAAFVGSWLAARFALDRFRDEKTWERRAAAYTTIFEAFHDLDRWLNDEIGSLKFADDNVKWVRESKESSARESNAAIARRIASESWILSDAFRKRFEAYKNAFVVSDDNNLSFLQAMRDHNRKAVEDLREIVRKDLNVKAGD